jgi:hypothetical protein
MLYVLRANIDSDIDVGITIAKIKEVFFFKLPEGILSS